MKFDGKNYIIWILNGSQEKFHTLHPPAMDSSLPAWEMVDNGIIIMHHLFPIITSVWIPLQCSSTLHLNMISQVLVQCYGCYDYTRNCCYVSMDVIFYESVAYYPDATIAYQFFLPPSWLHLFLLHFLIRLPLRKYLIPHLHPYHDPPLSLLHLPLFHKYSRSWLASTRLPCLTMSVDPPTSSTCNLVNSIPLINSFLDILHMTIYLLRSIACHYPCYLYAKKCTGSFLYSQ